MSFYTMADNNVPITANRDAALYNAALANEDFVVKGLGSEFAPQCEGLQFSVGTGIALIHGRHVTCERVTDANTITLPTNTSGYVAIRMDLSRPVGQEAYLYATPALAKEEINWNGTNYDFPIAQFTSTSANATITDVRVIKENTTGGPDLVKQDLELIVEGAPTLTNADMLGGYRPSYYMFAGADVDRIIASGGTSYTAETEDCWVYVYLHHGNTYDPQCYIDNKPVFTVTYETECGTLIPMKKGQKMTITPVESSATRIIYVYGLKKGE